MWTTDSTDPVLDNPFQSGYILLDENPTVCYEYLFPKKQYRNLVKSRTIREVVLLVPAGKFICNWSNETLTIMFQFVFDALLDFEFSTRQIQECKQGISFFM